MIRGIIFTAMLMLMDASPSLGGVGIPLSSPHLFWTENKVPYVITTAHDPAIIFSAIKEFQSKTNIRFVPRSDEKDFLELAGAPENEHPCSWGGSTSRWGKRPGRQILSLGPGCKLGNYIHELAHVLGMYHEQQHPDRDRFILVSFNNIISGFKAYFEINPSWIPAPGQAHSPFDFKSIMLYHSHAYSSNGKPTITKLDGSLYKTNYNKLSAGDVKALNRMYPSIK